MAEADEDPLITPGIDGRLGTVLLGVFDQGTRVHRTPGMTLPQHLRIAVERSIDLRNGTPEVAKVARKLMRELGLVAVDRQLIERARGARHRSLGSYRDDNDRPTEYARAAGELSDAVLAEVERLWSGQ